MPILMKGERELLRDSAKHWWRQYLFQKYGSKAHGTLILTNKRLIFEEVTGLISKSTKTKEISFSITKNVSVTGLIFKKLVVEAGGLHAFKVKNAPQWAIQLQAAIQQKY